MASNNKRTCGVVVIVVGFMPCGARYAPLEMAKQDNRPLSINDEDLLMPGMNRLSIAAIVIGMLVLQSARGTPLPDEKDHVISLNGTWRFKLEQKSDAKEHDTGKHPIVIPENPEPFQKPDYKEDSSWHDIAVPSNWEMLGYSPATYGQPDNAIGIYRLEFDVPAGWKGRHVGIDFDGVNNGAEVYLNGQPVNVLESSWGRKNYHEGGFNPFQVDLTPAVKFGKKNLLAVRVIKNTRSADMDTGDFFFLGGIYRNVQLFSVPTTFVNDLTVRTTLLPDDKAEVRVILGIDGKAKATATLEGEPSVDADASNTAVIVDHPKLWSAEKPNLYNLSVDLKDDAGNVLEHLTKRIGIRQITIKDGVMMVNNEPVKLAGMCRQEDWATLGAALGPEQWRKDITMMKAANINAIRTSHYPYASGFYDLCDELGMYVADEMAACWVPTNTDELTPAFAQHAREYVQRDKNHPCVIIWAIGNENNKPSKNYFVSAGEIQKIDPTRPRACSWDDGSDFGVELDDRHYTRPSEIAAAEASPRALKYPRVYLENPNMWEIRNGADYGCDDQLAAVIDRCWKEIFKDKHIPGTFIWEWADRAVADQCPTKLYDVFPETGAQLVKVKGLVDSWRNPRAALYSVKMACSPVQVDYSKPQISGDTVTLWARNYYSFTNFSELNTTWHLLGDGQEKAKGQAHPDVAPMSEGAIKLKLPVEALASADVLRVDFDWPDSRNVITYDIRLKPEKDTAPPHSAEIGDIKFPHLNFTTVDFANGPNGWRQAFRHPGKLMNVQVFTAKGRQKMDDTALYSTPLVDVKSVDADIQMDVVPASNGGNKKAGKGAQREAVMAAESQNVGHVHVQFGDGHFAYLVNWKYSKAGHVQELGWTFMTPKSADHFSWHRQAYWSYYPPDQIGRAEGTAMPDSADQQLTKLSRVDAFDFNSTKYHCDWASLADQAGNGIVIICSPQDRQQCRGGIEPDGYELVVNKQCSPPEDISSGDVPDFYMTLSGGGSAGAQFTVAAMQK